MGLICRETCANLLLLSLWLVDPSVCNFRGWSTRISTCYRQVQALFYRVTCPPDARGDTKCKSWGQDRDMISLWLSVLSSYRRLHKNVSFKSGPPIYRVSSKSREQAIFVTLLRNLLLQQRHVSHNRQFVPKKGTFQAFPNRIAAQASIKSEPGWEMTNSLKSREGMWH